jgi:hypothetical protein
MKSDLAGCHRCGDLPAMQWMRRAGEAEAAIQRQRIAVMQGRELSDAEIEAKYGPLREAVTGCAVHHLGVAEDPDSGGDRRVLLHDADCGGHGECVCPAR